MRERLVAATAVAAVLLTPASALAQEVVVEPLEAAVGEAIVLRGAGCPAAGAVDVLLVPEVGDPVDFAEVPVLADAQGAFEAPDLIVPEADPGTYVVVAECGTERFEAPFTLVAASTGTPSASPSPSASPTGAATPSPSAGTGTEGTGTEGTGTGTGTGTDGTGTDGTGTDGTGTDGTGTDQVQAPAGGVATGGGGGAEGPALALAAGGLMLLAGTGMAARAVRNRG